MMVLGAVLFSQMAERSNEAPGGDKTFGLLPDSGMDSSKANGGLIQSLAKMEELSCSLDEGDEDDDNDDTVGDSNWKNQACLLCGKMNDDSSKLDEVYKGKAEPYLCTSCSQRFELIQQVALAGEDGVDGKASLDGDDEDGEDEDADMKPIVSLEEADEELLVPGGRRSPSPPRLRAGRRAAAAALSAGALECAECQERFADAASLERHAMAHLGAVDGDDDRPFKCDVCLRGFNRKDKLKLHVMIHRGDKPLKCDVCGKAFLRRDHLKNHVKTHSKPRAAAKQAVGPGPGAGRAARAPRAVPYGAPAGSDDGDGVGLEADGDAAGLGALGALGAPGDRDKAERPFGCEVCHKMFSRKDNLAAHMRIHTGEKPFGCDLCGKCFAEKCALKRHMVVHTQEKLYPCGICGRSFARKGHLTEHVWLHDEVKPFLCNVCGKAFARDRKLKSHMMTHSGERPHKCDVCERAFARRDNLKSHLSLHYGVKPSRGPRPGSVDADADPGHGHGQGAAADGSCVGRPGAGILGAVGISALDPCSVSLPLAIPAASHPQHLLGLMGTMEFGVGPAPLSMATVGVAPAPSGSLGLGVSVGMGLVPS